MRLVRGVILASLVLPLGLAVAGCDTLENLELWDSKKKLPGARKPVFPEGVPGVSQGIPPELMKGYKEPAQVEDPAAAAAQQAAAQPESKQVEAPKPKPKPKPTPKAVAQSQPQSPSSAQAQEPAPQQAQAPWPAPQPQAPWPTAPPPGTFSR